MVHVMVFWKVCCHASLVESLLKRMPGGTRMAAAGAGSGFPPGAAAEPLAAGRASPGGLLSVLGALVSPRTWLAVIHLLAGVDAPSHAAAILATDLRHLYRGKWR